MFGIISLALARLQVGNTTNGAPVVATDISVTDNMKIMTISETANVTTIVDHHMEMEYGDEMKNMDGIAKDVKDLVEEMLMKVESEERDRMREEEDKKVIEMMIGAMIEKVANDGVGELEDGEIVDMMDVDEDDEAEKKRKADWQKSVDEAKKNLRSTLKLRRKDLKRKHQDHQNQAKQAKKARLQSYES